jgi:hypothetical protein
MMIQSARIIFLHTGSESLNTGTVNKSRYTYELINMRARKPVYVMSSQFRVEHNHCPISEPRSAEEIVLYSDF